MKTILFAVILGLFGAVRAQAGETKITGAEISTSSAFSFFGRVDGTDPSAGFVGEIISISSGPTTTGNGATTPVGNITLTPGRWYITATSYSDNAATQTGAVHSLRIKGVAGSVIGKTLIYAIGLPARASTSASFSGIVVNVVSGDADKTVYVSQASQGATGSGYCYISALRIN